MDKCDLCPRFCGKNRTKGEKGVCGETATVRVARSTLHMWEEPCISGSRGSGTVFFTGCNLKCIYCQNVNISRGNVGKEVTVERLAELFIEQQKRGANNINLVTPTHFVPQIRAALILAKEWGLRLPVVYNSSAYETVETLRMLEGLVDVYLPDFKYFNDELGQKYSGVKDYFEMADRAVCEMVRQTGNAVFSDGNASVEDGIMLKGVIVRHLVLPGCKEDSKKIIAHLHNAFGDKIYISIMNQYTPMENIGAEFPELNCRVSPKAYDEVVDYAIDIGVENGFIQEGETSLCSFIPEFDMEGI